MRKMGVMAFFVVFVPIFYIILQINVFAEVPAPKNESKPAYTFTYKDPAGDFEISVTLKNPPANESESQMTDFLLKYFGSVLNESVQCGRQCIANLSHALSAAHILNLQADPDQTQPQPPQLPVPQMPDPPQKQKL